MPLGVGGTEYMGAIFIKAVMHLVNDYANECT